MFKTLFFFILLVSTFHGNSQEIIKATSQGWAGGVCCVSGTNYSVTFLLKDTPKTIEIEGVYLQNTDKLYSTLSHPLVQKDGTYYTVNFPTRFDENDRYLEKEIKPIVTKNFDGKALILLKIDKKTVEIVVTEFESMGFLAYP